MPRQEPERTVSVVEDQVGTIPMISGDFLVMVAPKRRTTIFVLRDPGTKDWELGTKKVLSIGSAGKKRCWVNFEVCGIIYSGTMTLFLPVYSLSASSILNRVLEAEE